MPMLVGGLIVAIAMWGAINDWDEKIIDFISINRVAIAKTIGIAIVIGVLWLSVFWGLFLIGTIIWFYLKYIKEDN